MFSKKIALVLMLGALLPCLACSSSGVCPPNEPIFKFKEVPRPYPVLVKIQNEECPPLPDYPPHPGHDADEEEKKAWALETKRVADEREALNEACIDAKNELIDTHNRFIVEEPDVPGPPD